MSDHEHAYLICENKCLVEGVPKAQYDEELANKANSNHTHPISDVTGLQTALNGKVNLSATKFSESRVHDNITIPSMSVGSFLVVDCITTEAEGESNSSSHRRTIKLPSGGTYLNMTDLTINTGGTVIRDNGWKGVYEGDVELHGIILRLS